MSETVRAEVKKDKISIEKEEGPMQDEMTTFEDQSGRYPAQDSTWKSIGLSRLWYLSKEWSEQVHK